MAHAIAQDRNERSVVSKGVILAAARTLFATKGYAGTSINDIVEAAGTSTGLPYYHFGSKKQIFLALYEDFEATQGARTHAAVAAARARGAEGVDLLLAGLGAYLEGAWAARDLVPVIHGSDTPAGFSPALALSNMRWERQNRALLASYGGELPRAAEILLRGGMQSLCLELSGCGSQVQAGELISSAVMLLGGLLETLR